MNPEGKRLKSRAVAIGLAVVTATGVSMWSLVRDGQVEYDGAVYLERGLYHAEQVAARGNFLPLRLAWSLQFESPKPPLYHGLLAGAALVVGRSNLADILIAGTLLPFLILLLGVQALARPGPARAPLAAVLIIPAMPVVLEMGTRILTEVLLAACVTWAGVAAIRVMRGGAGVTSWIALGVAVGFAALAKLTGVYYGGLILLVAVVTVWRRDAAAKCLLSASISMTVAVTIAGGWYLRNGADALAFGRGSANSWAQEDEGQAWSRPARLVARSVGIPIALSGLSLAGLAWKARRSRDHVRRMLDRLVAMVAVVSAIMVSIPRNFDPRFWTPALGLVAAWIGIEVIDWAKGPKRHAIAGFVLLAALTTSVAVASEDRGSSAPWILPALIEERFAERTSEPILCNLGESYDWNRFQMRLMAQVARVRPRAAVVDLLHDVTGADVADIVSKCDLLFVLDPTETMRDRSQVRENEQLMEVLPEVERLAASRLRRDRAAEAVLGQGARLRIWASLVESGAAGP